MDKFESHKLNNYSIKELLENPRINGIIYKVFNRYRRAIDLDELDSIKMTILWDCANRYDPSKGAQFTSFLYQQLTFACKNELKKRKNEFNNIENLEMLKNMGIKNTHKSANISDKSRDRSMHSGHEMYDMIDGLPPDIAKVLEQFDMLWLEIDMYDPSSLRQIKDSTSTKICTGENLFYMDQYLPYFEGHVADIFMIDVPWNGFSQSKKIGDLAEVFQHNVAPHNYYSHLSSFVSASLCASLPNVRIMEIDIDDVPWKDELTTSVPEIVDGYMTVPSAPGWGTEINEDIARAHPWDENKVMSVMSHGYKVI